MLMIFKNAMFLSLKLIFVITLLMIVYEFFEKSKYYNGLQRILQKPLEKLGFTINSTSTLAVGIVLGIAYGAGILIKNSLTGKMSQKDIILSSLFLATCHAVFEDTLIFVAIGGNGLIILGVRILLAILIIYFISKFLFKNI